MKSLRIVYALLLLIMLIASMMIIYVKVESASSPTIHFEIPTTIHVCENFTVNINIANVTELYAWELKLQWNTTLIEFLNTTEGAFLKSSGSTTFDAWANQTEGWFSAIAFLSTPSGVNGSGTLANLTFHCTGAGVSTINFSQTMLLLSPQSVPWNGYGDANGDGTITIDDAALVAMAWRTYIGDPEYNPNADFNSDGFVGLFDLVCVYLNFGKSDPDPVLIPEEASHVTSDGLVTQNPQPTAITWKWLAINTPVWYTVNVSFSDPFKVQGFNFNGTLGQISFNITSASPGNCTVTVPRNVADGTCMDGAFKVLINNTQVPCMLAWTATHTSIYFTYGSGAHSVVILGQKVTKINGDINQDGIVDIFDAIALSGHYDWKEDP